MGEIGTISMAKLFDMKAFLALTMGQRKTQFTLAEAKKIPGLRVVDTATGIGWVGTHVEYAEYLNSGPLPMPGNRLSSH